MVGSLPRVNPKKSWIGSAMPCCKSERKSVWWRTEQSRRNKACREVLPTPSTTSLTMNGIVLTVARRPSSQVSKPAWQNSGQPLIALTMCLVIETLFARVRLCRHTKTRNETGSLDNSLGRIGRLEHGCRRGAAGGSPSRRSCRPRTGGQPRRSDRARSNTRLSRICLTRMGSA